MMRIITITITTIAPTALPTTVAMELDEVPPGEFDFGGEETVVEEDGGGTRMVVKRKLNFKHSAGLLLSHLQS